jgi:predicted CopG family antitoxin
MKTISLTEEAYQRLKAWQKGKESLSEVVLKVVPKRGTAGEMEEGFRQLTGLSESQALEVAATLEWGNRREAIAGL